MKKLFLCRHTFEKDLTFGTLYGDGNRICYTLEDADRISFGFPKLYGVSAIPIGVYDVIVNRSSRFKRDLPLICNVPGFTGIRIHAGNTADDSSGCILTASQITDKEGLASRVALEKVLGFLDGGAEANLFIQHAPMPDIRIEYLKAVWREDAKRSEQIA